MTESLLRSEDVLAPELMETVWKTLAQLYGHRFISAFGPDPHGPAGRSWAKGLRGFTPTQLSIGFRACLNRSPEEWPSFHLFKSLCLGIPSMAMIKAEFDGKVPVTPFGRMVWECMPRKRWGDATFQQRERWVLEAYQVAAERTMRGDRLPTPSPALPAPEPIDHAARAKAELEAWSREFGIDLEAANARLMQNNPEEQAEVDGQQ